MNVFFLISEDVHTDTHLYKKIIAVHCYLQQDFSIKKLNIVNFFVCPPSLPSFLISFLPSFFSRKDTFSLLTKREEGREEGREKHQCETETDWLPPTQPGAGICVPGLGIEPTS